jgi:hypothetical protein
MFYLVCLRGVMFQYVDLVCLFVLMFQCLPYLFDCLNILMRFTSFSSLNVNLVCLFVLMFNYVLPCLFL